MNKIMTIIGREYLVRVKSRAFILSTFLFPLLLAGIMIIPVIAAINVEREEVIVYVTDESGEVMEKLLKQSDDYIKYEVAKGEFYQYTDGSLLKEGEIALRIPPKLEDGKTITADLYSRKKITLGVKDAINSDVRKGVQTARYTAMGISEEALKEAKFSLKVKTHKIGETGEEKSTSAEVAAVTGYVMSFLIYFMLLFYGMFVMRGVIEEKTNRIVEVIISSVKPFQLMMGKLLGICAVGLTQIFLWGILSTVIFMIIGGIIGSTTELDPVELQKNIEGMQMQGMSMQASGPNMSEGQEIIQGVLQTLSLKNLFLFVFYFLGGYLLYGALFAAVGSAVDQESDAQQFTFPVMMPLIIPMLLISNIIQNPNGTLTTVLSHIPFTSPIIMMMRATSVEVPWWELLLSMAFLILGILGSVWLASRIYRVGVLMYGKKVTFREIGKWIFKY